MVQESFSSLRTGFRINHGIHTQTLSADIKDLFVLTAELLMPHPRLRAIDEIAHVFPAAEEQRVGPALLVAKRLISELVRPQRLVLTQTLSSPGRKALCYSP